jgi:peroxiredoxin
MARQQGLKLDKKVREFVLKDQNGQDFRLSSFKGRKILLSFHPLAWTPVCAAQMKSLEKNHKTFEKLNTVAVGISIDHIPCKSAWAKTLKINKTRLLCDFWPHGKVAKYLGIFRDKEGFSERANIILDNRNRVIFFKIYPLRELPDVGEVIAFLKEKQ